MATHRKQNERSDAFLSYNNQDKQQVEQIARCLEEKAGLRVWLDKWNVLPGDPWQEEIEKALDASGACVVFLGESGLGSWQHEEMRAVIADRVERQQTRVVPVLLPGIHRPEQESKLPRFLRRLSWVKFNADVNEEENRSCWPGVSGAGNLRKTAEKPIHRYIPFSRPGDLSRTGRSFLFRAGTCDTTPAGLPGRKSLPGCSRPFRQR